jgi:hypothetical protein
MSDITAPETATTEPGDNNAGATDGFTAPKTQAEFDAMVQDRLKRERAKYADYNDLKTKATEFDKLTEAQKTEIQRATERAEAAERAALEKESALLRLSVIAKHSIPADYQDLVTGQTEEELEEKAAKVLTLIPNSTGQVRPDYSQGPKAPGGTADPGQLFAQHLKNQLGH